MIYDKLVIYAKVERQKSQAGELNTFVCLLGGVCVFVCLFVCLFNRSLSAETHLGPDETRLKQNAQARLKSLYKVAGQLVYGNVKREKQTRVFM